MLRSMYSGISGMKNFQTKLDVIGNNIANVNTYGFKKSRVTFGDLMNQTVAGASAGSTTRGGTNAMQVGLGSKLSTIDTIHTNSSQQTTNRSLDLSVNGDGYFVVSDGTKEYYTRAGNFYLDQNGKLVNSEGLKVKDKDNNEITIPSDAQSFTIGKLGEINIIGADGSAKLPIQQLAVATFNNSSGLTKSGDNIFEVSSNSGAAKKDIAGSAGHGTITSGSLEMSNVDLSEEFTDMIVAQRGFQANSRIITTSDEILQELVNLKR
ncbi:flagellar basal body rod protein FlgG [Peribacillus psychrosaccharolyticus]|uniref:Flagellar hook protein FlgE n=1 Tax=Peribacillus psychrosaccharolyticus TaxID=1407 RepID=A0A974S1F6_PERPY|nr:flagellar basal body rod protein FlgG [Peribacillus psychrosaccharolyticus]MEC2053810.1 flagellar basal body rod protein FlgG [Peribacillus psychrosaccharolyticus]MED3742576.1 flagellar basal body rod protein FlgG [Peribacillus psychrosaccharolyticus]QQT01524.1 flagellar basal body rod protein FlgG [Peribacillus psychrosaccharolyticus]